MTPNTHDSAQQTRHVGFRCRPDEFQEFARAARADERSMSGWIRRILKEAAAREVRPARSECAK